MQWPPSLADVLAAGVLLGTAFLNIIHSYMARRRMFALQRRTRQELKVHRAKINVLIGIAEGQGYIRKTQGTADPIQPPEDDDDD
jgi:hypothetical protein